MSSDTIQGKLFLGVIMTAATPITIEQTVTTSVTKKQPPYAVIVHNDDDHTYEYVVELFGKVFRYDRNKCHTLAMEIHYKGKSLVWSGSLEVAELKQEQLQSGGKDHYSARNVDYPLNVTIEPMV